MTGYDFALQAVPLTLDGGQDGHPLRREPPARQGTAAPCCLCCLYPIQCRSLTSLLGDRKAAEVFSS